MKKKSLIITIIIVVIGILTSCAEKKIIDGTTYEPYGFANESTHKNDSIQYEISAGSVIFAVIFSETIIAPVYIVGWDLYEPIKKK